MIGSQLFDCLANDDGPLEIDPSESDALVQLGEGMLSTSIASGKMLQELRERMFPDSDDPAAMAVAHALRGEFQRWAGEADDVFQRARALRDAGHQMAGLEELGHLIGRTRAMLRITPENHLLALQHMGDAQPISVEELRRELRLQPHRIY